MRSWAEAVRAGIVSGSAASLASTLTLLASGAAKGRTFAPVNAVSHWIWDERAIAQNRPSFRYTVLGYLVHHAAATFWAVLQEKFAKPGRTAPQLLRDAALTSAIAYVTDFHFTPRRFTPGYERRLSRNSLILVYSSFALGLAAAALLHREHPG